MGKDLVVKMSHGSGRGHSELLSKIVLPSMRLDTEKPLEDAFDFETGKGRFAFTTDSFVVTPVEFKEGISASSLPAVP